MHNKLAAIQSALKVPKSQRNTFGNYNYRSCEDILEALKPLLKEQGLVLVLSDEMVSVGTRNYVKATATLTTVEEAENRAIVHPLLYHGAAQSIVITSYAREEETKKGMDGSQITGAASSYARKYALNGLFLIDDARDSDATNTHEKEETSFDKPTEEELAKQDIPF